MALGIAMVGASYYVYGVPLPWDSIEGNRVFPMIIFLVLSMIVFSLLTAQMSGPGVPRPTYGRMFAIALGTGATTSLLIVFSRIPYFSRAFLGFTAVVWLVLATAHRLVRRRRPWTERIAIVTGEKQLAEDLVGSPHAEVVWVLDPKFDGPIELPDRDVTMAVDLRALLSERMAQFLSSSDVAGYNIRAFTSIYEEHTGRVPLVHLAEGWEISAPLLEVAPWLPGKRVFDTIVTAVTAPLWLGLGLLVGIYIRLATRGPALFRQERIGYEGKPFTMYKFRTMDEDAEKDGPKFATKDDGRLTRGGKFLRKSRLDEVPQLWNVLKGEMSLVGPRAEQVPFVAAFRQQIPFYEHRHLVRPGITGWAQVNYGYADDHADTIEKLTYDLYYIKHMSPVMDLRVLWKSVWTVLTGAGAR
ncbi:MAG: sugar transferase [Actinomycetota bacterium]|nr:sugar transferase [Actinomycetota bacterium]